MTSRRRRLTFGVQLGTFVVLLGIPNGLLGPLWPTMHHDLHRPVEDLGQLVAAATVLYLGGGLVSSRVAVFCGRRLTVFCCTVLGFGALCLWSLGRSWALILVALGLLGLAQGLLDAVVNAAAALDGGVRRLGILHASWAIGGTLGPLLVAALASGGDWRLSVGAVAIAEACLIPFAALAEGGDEAGSAAPLEKGAPPETPRRPRLGLFVTTLAFVLYVAAEAAPISWGPTYLVSDRHLTPSDAAIAVALYWAGLALGRLYLAAPQRFDPRRVLEWSAVAMVAGLALFWLLPGKGDLIGLPIAGLGSATIFPLYVALTPERLGTEATGRAVGYAIAGAAFGGPGAVELFGVLAAHFGTGVLAPCLFGAGVLMYLSHRLLGFLTEKGSVVPYAPTS